jgi:hydrogenase expression/formation protein HypE
MSIKETLSVPLGSTSGPRLSRVVLAHGGGGQLTDALLREAVLPRLGNPMLNELLDAGFAADGQYAITIDGYVVQPLFFPGGDIGRLAISGTVNDLAVCGCRPVGIAMALILAEGLERRTLDRVMESVSITAKEADVSVITGDTKVVGRGHADGMYLTTAGIGIRRQGTRLNAGDIASGDVLLINGPIGEHGLAVMLAREMPEVDSVLQSDAAPLNGLIDTLLNAVPSVLFMRDATRSGLAGVAADLAAKTQRQIILDEEHIPVRTEALHAAEMLGLDPLDIANEGKVVVVVRKGDVHAALKAMRSHPLGRDACEIGRVGEARDGLCVLNTAIGGRRIVQKPYGEQLPRIC